MDNNGIEKQASQIVDLFPKVMRRLFSLEEGDPAADLPVGQLRVCGVLRDGFRTMSALSKELRISLSATTQLADRLEKSGIVERVCEEGDRRVKCLKLTSHGEQVMRDRHQKRVTSVVEVLSQLPPESREGILAALGELTR